MANPWNPNRVNAENKRKLENSLDDLGNFKPIIVRELPDGRLEIIGGENRRNVELSRGSKTVPILNLGLVDDARAKKMSLIDNERYGEDDITALQKVLQEFDSQELLALMPVSEDEFDSFWSKDSINLDDLDLDEEDELPTNVPTPTSAPTHRVVRFKLSVADAERLSEVIERTQKANGLTTSDALTNAGDALIHLLKGIW